MELRVIEGIKVERGDILVVIPPTPINEMQRAMYSAHALALGLKLIFLPHGSSLYIQAGAEDATGS